MTFLIILAQGCKKHLPNNITTPCCYKCSVFRSQAIWFKPHAGNEKTEFLCGLVYKLLSGFETKTACKLAGHRNFFRLTLLAHQPRPKLAAMQLHAPVDMLLMWWEVSETFSALRKFILDQLFNGIRHLAWMWPVSTKPGDNSYNVCQIVPTYPSMNCFRLGLGGGEAS